MIWFAWTLGLSAFFVYVAAANLGNFPPVSNDEVWIMSTSYKLATQGILGSDPWAGFFNADQHYLIGPPVHYILQAVSFRISGAGVAQARFVSVASAVAIIWAVSWLAYRWYGLAAALLAGVLLIFWRSNLTAGYLGLPLLAVARSGRYDVDAVAWTWLSIGLLDRSLRRPGRITGLALGLCSGLALLTQFFGAFILLLVAVAWLWYPGGHTLTETTSYWILAGFMLVVLPYGLYAALYSADLVRQITLHTSRAQLNTPGFYLDNIRREPDRFAHLLRWPAPVWMGPDAFNRPFSPWLLIVGIWPALVYLWRRARRTGAIGDRLLGLSLLIFSGLLALLEEVKAPLYGIVLLPSVCLALAVSGAGVLDWAWQEGQRLPIRVGVGSLAIGLLAIIVVESAYAYQVDRRQSAQVNHYLDVGQKIDSYLAPGARLLGAERWWWALHDHPYLALNNVWAQWEIAAQAGKPPEFVDWVTRDQAEFILVNEDIRDSIREYPKVLQSQFSNFLSTCGVRTAEWTDATYAQIEIYRIAKAPSALPACQP